MADPRHGPPPGVIVRSNGTFAFTPERPRSRDLDRLPLPAFDAFPVEAYDGMYRIRRNPALLLSSARGCPYQCIFCQNPGGTQYRYRSIDAVMDEIEHDLQRYPIRQIVFTDETFTINRKRTTALCEAMLSRGVPRRLRWVCETRVDAVTRDLLALLKEAGCEAISFGVEAGNQAVLDAIRKKSRKEEAVQAIRWCRELGIFTQSNFIIGHPDETRETISDTIRFALELGADSAGFSILVPFPGTEVMRMAERGEGGLRLLTRDWTKFGKQAGASLELEHLPRSVLERILLGAYLRFYLRPTRWLNAMRVAHLTAVPLFVGHILATHIRKLVGNGRTPDAIVSAG
ncbi:MAG: radical SAM protein [Nitrospirae bacterium]|nr:radical SAM protein [Nitrospirota bacterium]